MKKTLTSQEKFRVTIEIIISEQYTETSGKAQLTKIVNQWKKEEHPNIIKEAIKQVLLTIDLPRRVHWIQQRYTYRAGYFWLENSSSKYGDTILGWHNDPLQIQAEALPLELHYQRFEDNRYIKVLDWVGWDKRGFAAAENLPLCWHSRQVEIPVEKTWFFANIKYAAPCQLQWQRNYDHLPEEREFRVVRSIIPYGFWQAWKWWPEAKEWYYEHRPELFEDDEIWGKLSWHEPPNNYSAVLSPNNSNLLKSQIFHINE